MNAAEALPLTRETLATLPKKQLSTPSRFRPTVWRVETPQGDVIVKDTASILFGFGWYARLLVRREERALAELADLPQAPNVLGRLDKHGLVIECLTGKNLTRDAFRKHARAYADAIHALTTKMHEHGVYHLDLHAKGNILLDGNGGVSVVDFGAAVVPGSVGMFLMGWFYRWVDSQAPLKYLARYAPWEMTAAEARRIIHLRRWRRVWFVKPHSESALRRAKRRLDDIEAGRESDPAEFDVPDDKPS